MEEWLRTIQFWTTFHPMEMIITKRLLAMLMGVNPLLISVSLVRRISVLIAYQTTMDILLLKVNIGINMILRILRRNLMMG